MTTIATRSSVLAVKVESTEGTPVVPAGATDYLALQDDFDVNPSFDVLENAELSASIGATKPIIGAENPTVSGSHYLRHSGVEGQEPDYGDLPYAAFGTRAVAGTEYDTDTGSTTTVLKVTTADAANFRRGQVVLIKDATNGYRIRALTASNGTTDLTLGFKVPTAPASGVNLGKCVLYYPANDSHPTLTVWHYLGNGGAVQMMPGCRVTEFDCEAAAGELLNASYSLEALAYYFNPIQIAASSKYLDFTDDDATYAAIVTAAWYKDPHELAAAIQQAMNDAAVQTYTVTYLDASGQFKIVGTGTLLTLKWNTGTNTANSIASKIGFSTAADSSGTGATTGYTGTALSFASPYTPTLDSSDPLAVKGHEVMIGDQTDYLCAELSTVKFTVSNSRRVTASICAESGRSGSKITSREVTVGGTFEIQKYDVDKFRRFRAGTSTQLQYSFGIKSGGNWVAGKCGALFVPTFTITSFKVTDDDGVATCEFEGKAFVSTAGDEVYLGFV